MCEALTKQLFHFSNFLSIKNIEDMEKSTWKLVERFQSMVSWNFNDVLPQSHFNFEVRSLNMLNIYSTDILKT